MLKSIRGIYRNGQVKLSEPAPDGEGEVIVTFLSSEPIQLADREISDGHAVDLRHRLAAFAEDWDRPEMDSYDAL